nr:spore coat protein [Iocasia fonsfrigidae]
MDKQNNQFNQNQDFYQSRGQYGVNQDHYTQHNEMNQPYNQQYTNRGQQNQQMTIQNPKSNIQQQTGPDMNDRDFLNDILATEKYLSDGFNVFAREASHGQLYNDVIHILNETHDCERDLFNLMFEHGFYSFKAAAQQDIQQAHQQFSDYINKQDPYLNQRMQ